MKGMKTKYFVLMDVLSNNFFFFGGNSLLHYNRKDFFNRISLYLQER